VLEINLQPITQATSSVATNLRSKFLREWFRLACTSWVREQKITAARDNSALFCRVIA
jgi:hypothetical protein